MSTPHTIYQFLLSTNGTNQLQRSALALAEDYVRMDERGYQDILQFLYQLSQQIRFFDLHHNPSGDWRPFLSHFIEQGNVVSLQRITELESLRDDWPPHAALLWSFLKVFSISQADMNTLTGKHLSYYYQNVLRLPAKEVVPDKAHVLFTPSKSASPTLLTKETLLDAGTFPDGVVRQFKLDHDIVVNQAIIEKLLSSYTDVDKSGRKILFVSSDAKKIQSSQTGSWRPFGTSQLNTSIEQRNMDAAMVGFAIASPVLALSEGRRVITLTLSLPAKPIIPNQILTAGFEIEVTSIKEWIKPTSITAQFSNNKLIFTATFPESNEAITPYISDIHGQGYNTPWPLIRCRLKPQSFLLETLDPISVNSIEISVAVTGMTNLVLQNDQAIQLPDKPIIPFTSQPFIGANFYIGSPEVFHKSVTSLSVHLTWQDPPPDMAAHYNAYGIGGMTNTTTFETMISILASKNWNTLLLNGPQSLFNQVTETTRDIVVNSSNFSTAISTSGFSRKPDSPVFNSYSSNINQGFIKLQLTGPRRADFGNLPADAPFEAFGHKTFPSAYAHQVIIVAQNNGVGDLPKPPYTPTLKSVTLDYTAKEIFYPSNPNYIDEYFIEDLFGPYRVNKNQKARVIPEIPGDGALYVGLKNATAPQSVSMLFQFEEGSTPGDQLIETDEISWSYLGPNGWINIDASQILEDSTKELQAPGLIRLNLGQDAISDSTQVPTGLHWLRLMAMDHADGASSILDLRVQAATATLFTSGEIYSSQGSIPENTITGLVKKRSAIKKVEQPYPSFGGSPKEELQMYSRRISERIRHRNRAVTTWDYERIILDRFPDIFKVKCIPHVNIDNEISPGAIRAVVVPDWKKRKSGDPLQPAANAAFLREIEDLLNNEYAVPFTNIVVTNPTFETLLVDTKVSFLPGFDPGFYAQQLEEEIKRFLSPWAYDEGQDIQFGGKIYRSEILAFVEGREYVDFVVDFNLYHRHGSGTIGGIGQMEIGLDFIIGVSPVPTVNEATIGLDFIIGEPVDFGFATKPDSILVSNSYHRINVLHGENICKGIMQTGIGQMIIGIDFVPIS